MIHQQDLIDKFPGLAWNKHRFLIPLQLVEGGVLYIPLEFEGAPSQNVEPVSPATIEKELTAAGLEAKSHSVYEAIADTVTEYMKIIGGDLAYQYAISIQVFEALRDKEWTVGAILLRLLANALKPYEDVSWLYEWPEWLRLVRDFMVENCQDSKTLEIIQKSLNSL